MVKSYLYVIHQQLQFPSGVSGQAPQLVFYKTDKIANVCMIVGWQVS
jgi:hypothetical protein